MEKFLTGLFAVFGVIGLVVLIMVLLAFPVMWIWNYVMPDIFGLPQITVWQALWGGILMRLLFGTGNNSG